MHWSELWVGLGTALVLLVAFTIAMEVFDWIVLPRKSEFLNTCSTDPSPSVLTPATGWVRHMCLHIPHLFISDSHLLDRRRTLPRINRDRRSVDALIHRRFRCVHVPFVRQPWRNQRMFSQFSFQIGHGKSPVFIFTHTHTKAQPQTNGVACPLSVLLRLATERRRCVVLPTLWKEDELATVLRSSAILPSCRGAEWRTRVAALWTVAGVCERPPGWCRLNWEALCACGGQSGRDCRRGGDGDCGGCDAFGCGEDQAGRKRRMAALCALSLPSDAPPHDTAKS
jgi:hypothetical protein